MLNVIYFPTFKVIYQLMTLARHLDRYLAPVALNSIIQTKEEVKNKAQQKFPATHLFYIFI